MSYPRTFKGVFYNGEKQLTQEGTAVITYKKSGNNWKYYVDSWNVLKTY